MASEFLKMMPRQRNGSDWRLHRVTKRRNSDSVKCTDLAGVCQKTSGLPPSGSEKQRTKAMLQRNRGLAFFISPDWALRTMILWQQHGFQEQPSKVIATHKRILLICTKWALAFLLMCAMHTFGGCCP